MKIGLSTPGNMVSEELFKNYVEAGIEYAEITADLNGSLNLDFSKIKEIADKCGVKLWSFHLPFAPFADIDISSLDEEKRIYTVNINKALIEKGSKVGIDKYIIHGSDEPISDDIRSSKMEASKKSLKELADFADKFGATVLVEDLPRTCLGRNSDEILELLSADEKLRVVFDTNHLLNEEFSDFFKKCGKKIRSVHVSDYDFIDEKHWLPGEGELDWHRLYKELLDAGYSGIWLYELGFENTPKITRSRNLTCEDFVRNANEIFENKKLTVIK